MLLPSYQSLIANYPGSDYDSAAVRNLIKGEVNNSNYTNTCVIRMSRAFNYANPGKLFDIPANQAGLYTVKGGDGLNYALKVAEFKNYMEHQYGSPSLVQKPTGSNFSAAKFMGLGGIIMFQVSGWGDATGHFTFWEGSSCVYCGPHDYFNMTTGKVKTSTISLWKC